MSDFYQIAVPEQRQVIGLKLRPLALGHIILLERVQSAFITGQPPSYEDLALSALICSLSFEDGVEALRSQDAALLLKELAERITGSRSWLVRLGLRRPRVIDLEANCAAFSDYIREHSRIPHYTYTPGDFKTMECPSVQVVKVCLMREMHFGESEILNRSWALCLWDYVTLRAIKGEVSMISRDTIKGAQEAAMRVLELVKQGKVKVPGK